jgi:WXG100 family type VII secretion target
MAEKIKVTPEQLKSTAARFSEEAETVRQLSELMMQIARSISGAWTGAAAAAYVSRLQALETDIRHLVQMIQSQSLNLLDMARNYTEAENLNAEAAGALARDVVSL